ncbi:uncharacterized protein LOC142588318 isoform X1 [Dermacentor variabilis]|uniref:uncharacterized protein LOC142588318 isoform X1 n=1 Tax=Dermacentor variabilis TaxID=34621 RepID=UPI003F5C07E2
MGSKNTDSPRHAFEGDAQRRAIHGVAALCPRRCLPAPEPSGEWDLEDVCTVLAAISLLLVALVGVPLCFYWDSRCVLLTIGSLVALCIMARVVHERRAAANHARHHWLSLTASFLVQQSPQERDPLVACKSANSV